MDDIKNYVFKPDDFELIQSDKKIFDTKFETKATTFFRDALKRFSKNKSSVVAAFLIGILVGLTVAVPSISDHNITTVSPKEAFLAPKLFEAGTGFWDGTRKKERIVYDTVNEVPALSEKYTQAAIKQSIVSINVDPEPALIDAANPYGKGGYVVVSTDTMTKDDNSLFLSKSFKATVKDNYKVSITLGTEDGVSDSKLGRASFIVMIGDEENVLDDVSSQTTFEFDLSRFLKEKGLTTADVQVGLMVYSAEDAYRYVLLKDLVISADETAANADVIDQISFTDATKCVLISDTKDMGYWSCTGRKGIHSSEVYYCDFVIDTYMLVYGDADSVTYSATEINTWIENGWCEYDYKVGPESFVRLTDDCPIDIVESQTVMKVTKKLSSITARGWNYRKLGYSEMPRFVMGTDASGFDLFKRSFKGLRTSFILSIVSTLFCFCFGLVWGSISGYFGGNVDIAMERFCEILGGVPFIVVMTLAILHFGNNFGTFVMAICLTGWMGTAGLTRTQFYRFKGREYILASRTLGAKDTRLIFRHILPNSMGTIITSSVLMISSTIYTESTLAFLNLGLQGKEAFGVMMASNQQYLSKYPNLVIFPAAIMAILMVSLNLFGNGLRDAFNPSLKGSD